MLRAHYGATVMLDRGHRLCFDNKKATGAVDDIVKTDKLPHALWPALTDNPRVLPLGGNKQRVLAKDQSFDIEGAKPMSSA